MSELDELFARAREIEIEAICGVVVKGPQHDRRGPCPLCGGPKGTQRFSVNNVKRVWKCHVCQRGGDVIKLETELRGGAAADAARRLVGDISVPLDPKVIRERDRRNAEREREAARSVAYKARRAIELWRTAVAAKGTLVETYLRARGLYGPWLEAALGQLRFCPAVHHSGEGQGARGAPAMIGLRMTPKGPTGGVHITYLAAHGRDKAALDPAKRMLGAGDREGVPSAVWLTPPDAEGPLIVGEGIESTISAAILNAVWPCAMVATLSLENLQGGWMADKWGRVNVAMPSADFEQPAFTWPAPVGGWDRVLIAVDRDMKPIWRKARKALGGTHQVRLDAEARAKICASLACQQWRAAGINSVAVIAPGPGRDFNDEIRAHQTPAKTIGGVQ